MAVPRRLITPEWYRDHRWEIVFVIVAATLVFSVVGNKVNSDRISRQAQLGAETHFAVCKLRGDLRARYVNGELYLRTHPGQFKPGEVQAFRRQLAGNLRTLQALSQLRC